MAKIKLSHTEKMKILKELEKSLKKLLEVKKSSTK